MRQIIFTLRTILILDIKHNINVRIVRAMVDGYIVIIPVGRIHVAVSHD